MRLRIVDSIVLVMLLSLILSTTCVSLAKVYPNLIQEEEHLVETAALYDGGWLHFNSSCYWFSTTRLDFEPSMESCAEKGAFMADILTERENKFIKDVLMVVNPHDSTDYWAGAKPASGHWDTGAPMQFTDFFKGADTSKPFLHMNAMADFAWDTQDDRTDKDNRYICKKSL